MRHRVCVCVCACGGGMWGQEHYLTDLRQTEHFGAKEAIEDQLVTCPLNRRAESLYRKNWLMSFDSRANSYSNSSICYEEVEVKVIHTFLGKYIFV